jgi:hypothetical protein
MVLPSVRRSPVPAGKDGLIAFEVLFPPFGVLFLPLDVGRQGRVSDVFQSREDVGRSKVKDTPAFVSLLDDPALEAGREADGVAGPQPPSRPAQDRPSTGLSFFDKKEFDLGPVPRAPGLGRDDAGVVEDEHLAGAEKLREVLEPGMDDPAVIFSHDHHPGFVAPRKRPLGDELGRQVVIEICHAHASMTRHRPPCDLSG